MTSRKSVTDIHPTPLSDSAQSHCGDHRRLLDASRAANRAGGIRAWAMSGLRDLLYAGAVFIWSIAAFTVLVTGVSVTASLVAFVIGFLVWVGFVRILRWTTWVDRRLAGWQRKKPVPAAYRRVPTRGFLPMLRTVSSDPQTWTDMGWLALTSVAGFALGLIPITAVGVVLAYLSMPTWYWAISNPHDRYGLTNLGLYTVDTLGKALATAAIALALAPVALLLARRCATTHTGLAARVLGAPTTTRANDRRRRR